MKSKHKSSHKDSIKTNSKSNNLENSFESNSEDDNMSNSIELTKEDIDMLTARNNFNNGEFNNYNIKYSNNLNKSFNDNNSLSPDSSNLNDINVTSKFIENYLKKYNTYQDIIETIMKDEMDYVEAALTKLYEISEETWNNNEEDKFYPYFIEDISNFIRITERSPEDIIKLMYVLTIKINKVIQYHIEDFTKYESAVYREVKSNLINEINQEYNNNLKAKLGNNIVINNNLNSNNNNNEANKAKNKNNNINNNNNYSQHIFGNSFDSTTHSFNSFNYINEMSIINKLNIKDCYSVLDDLYTSYKVILRFLDNVYINFKDLISGYDMLLNVEKDLNKIFLEEFSILILEDSFFKVRF